MKSTIASPRESSGCLSGSVLKVIAMVTMLIDHAGVTLAASSNLGLTPWFYWREGDILHPFNLYRLCRDLGRLAFPIFGFLLLEGFLNTSNRKNYARNLLVFALLSEIPFNLMLTRQVFTLEYQNIFFTLLLSFLCMWGLEYFADRRSLQLLCIIAAVAAAYWGNVDYGINGIVFLLILYLTRYHRVYQTVFGCLSLYFEWIACFAFIPIRLYNGKRGFIHGKMKYFFYAFYPVHILVLVLLRKLLF